MQIAPLADALPRLPEYRPVRVFLTGPAHRKPRRTTDFDSLWNAGSWEIVQKTHLLSWFSPNKYSYLNHEFIFMEYGFQVHIAEPHETKKIMVVLPVSHFISKVVAFD